ncbi:TlpA family protein disulfide reductase [Aestuariibaculum lutulentum]|uniref:TlpA family protein disulfide reductase n=1 Tax=Aestuariibaculum lutulentum TaxID=2920935 RepID=A0ABS9REG1_9FLAO|nr:TlpA disulfide reductase family protein [Aestuariibaculum lutulentum]MCH4551334.1 TlpA family protein disulfide reductase [Aestuariibaculum lutulentum]
MKKQIIYVLACCMFMLNVVQARSKTSTATINGHLSFESKTNKITLHHVVNGQLAEHTTTTINANGDFAFQLLIIEPGFYYLDYGQYNNNLRGQVIRFYLEEGLEIKVDVNEESYELLGKNNGYNSLVQEANNMVNKFRGYNRITAMKTYEDFFPFLENEGQKMVEDFKNSINTKDQAFNDLLKLAVQADYESEAFFFFRLPRIAHPKKDNRPALYAELYTDGVKFSNPDILKLDNGVKWMLGYCYYYRYNSGEKPARVDVINNEIKHVSGDELTEVFVLESLKSLRLKPEEYEVVIPPLYKYLTSEESKNYILQFEKQMHTNKGQAGYEFTYNDVNGKPVSFSDFRGKFVYVDVWATWCGPCKGEIPHLKKLEHDYQGQDIVFLSVSVDKLKDQQKWKDFVKNEKLGGIQLMADNAFSSGIAKNYDITAIPRFLLFDKEGKIISTDALRPSNELLRNQFDALLGLEE